MNATHHSYAIRHLTLRLEAVVGSGRPRFTIGGKTLVVEAAAKEYLRSQGWWVLRGDEASLFLAVLSANFADSFFAKVCLNYVGANAPALIAKLDALCRESVNSGKLSAAHLDAAGDFLSRYYASPSDHRKFRRLATEIGGLSPHDQLALVKVYKAIGYFTKGIPDLFAVKAGEFMFVEVKSEGDALRPEQYVFAEAVLPEVETGFQVLRVISTTGGRSSQLANPADA